MEGIEIKHHEPEDEEVLISRLHQILRADFKQEMFESHKHKFAFAQKLKERYSPQELNSCRLYHLLIGSTPPSGVVMNRLDFEGEDSIEAFIESLPKRRKSE